MDRQPTYSLIVPIYKSRETLDELLAVTSTLNASLGGQLQLIFVVDGSPDHSLDYLGEALPQQAFQSRLITLSRNFGAFQAIRTGLMAADSDYFAVMAADLQEPPEFVLKGFQALVSEPVDVVIGTRESRQDPWMSTLSSRIFWGIYRRLIQKEMPSGGMDIFACNRSFRDNLIAMGESHSSLVGQVLWLGFRRKEIAYHRSARRAGVSAWSFSRKVRYLMDSVFSFTDLPITLLFLIGQFAILLSMFLILLTVWAKITGDIKVPGYTSLLIAVSFFAGLNSFGLGIIGTYVWRTYENTKARPLSIISHNFFFEGQSTHERVPTSA